MPVPLSCVLSYVILHQTKMTNCELYYLEGCRDSHLQRIICWHMTLPICEVICSAGVSLWICYHANTRNPIMEVIRSNNIHIQTIGFLCDLIASLHRHCPGYCLISTMGFRLLPRSVWYMGLKTWFLTMQLYQSYDSNILENYVWNSSNNTTPHIPQYAETGRNDWLYIVSFRELSSVFMGR